MNSIGLQRLAAHCKDVHWTMMGMTVLIVNLYLVAHEHHDDFGRNHAVNQVQIVALHRVMVNSPSNDLKKSKQKFNLHFFSSKYI